MTTLSLSRTRDARLLALGIVGFAIALAAAAQVSLPIPGTPVPFTLGPMLVVLAGMMLGPSAGAASMLLYLAAGAAGAPVFAPGGAPGLARFVGPTGGYLIAYPAAAFVAGWLTQRMPSLVGRWSAATLGIAVIFLGGIAQLAILSRDIGQAVALGLTPFALLDVVKAFLAALATGRGRRVARSDG